MNQSGYYPADMHEPAAIYIYLIIKSTEPFGARSEWRSLWHQLKPQWHLRLPVIDVCSLIIIRMR
ncbi:hypothetical protein [Desulfosporosinus acididurans]|uniref:hypothetical protein n=1 Tax=Desulfosporosinus acididurans TaxID=476652 RepID=UPI001A9A3736|nr:hypothetical protein [Desulfosporosinus acididurans]